MEEIHRHRHCLECISRECDVLECIMVNCIHGCGVVAHQCKMGDHEEVCANKIVPCINAINGCDAMMPRIKVREHLARCPAANCKMWKLQRSSLEECEHGCGSLVDQHNVLDHEVLCNKRIVHCSNATYGCKAMLPRCKLSAHLLHCSASLVHCKFSLLYDTKFASPALQFYTTTESAYQHQLEVLRGCNEVVRRDEFHDHHTMQHIIVHNSLYDWLVHCCPMMDEYGCDFKIPRLLPSPEYFKLVHNNCSGMFAVALKEDVAPFELEALESSKGWYIAKLQQQRELAAYGYDDEPTDLLCALPIEVLLMIIQYLDSSALLCLSLTNRMLWEACHNLKNGNMVEVTWKRHENGWKESLMWSYSRNTCIPRDWHFTNNDSAMNNHLQCCPYRMQQPYDDTKLWYCVFNGRIDDTFLKQVPSSSVDFNELNLHSITDTYIVDAKYSNGNDSNSFAYC